MKLRSIPPPLALALASALALTSTACRPAGATTQPASADLVLLDGAVVTMDPACPRAEAVAIRSGRIEYVGPVAGARARIGPRTDVLSLGGRTVLPGFVDAHQHLFPGAFTFDECRLDDLVTEAEVLDAVRACSAASPERPWLTGGGWGLTVFPGVDPSREALDAVAGNRPAYLVAGDYHQAWVNSHALKLAGIDEHTPDPPGGHIERDADGRPSGTLRESAMDLVQRVIPRPPLDQRLAGLRRAVAMLHQLGIVAVSDAAVGAVSGGLDARTVLETYREAERRGELSLDVVAALAVDPRRGPEQVAELVDLRRSFASPRVRPTAAKVFIDGVIESHTAAMLEPYLDLPAGDPLEHGEAHYTPETLGPLVRALVNSGFAIHMHAIGDRGVRLGLDALATAGPGSPDRRGRHQIAHLEVVHPDDVARFGALDVTATFQPLWASADDDIVHGTWPRLGPQRSQWIYPVGSLDRGGAELAFGSDWPVSSPAPLDAIQVAVTRRAVHPPRRDPLLPTEAIDPATALAAYTLGAARALGLDDELGSLTVGKRAHLVVLSADLLALPPDQLARPHVVLTLLDGVPVYREAIEADAMPRSPTSSRSTPRLVRARPIRSHSPRDSSGSSL